MTASDTDVRLSRSRTSSSRVGPRRANEAEADGECERGEDCMRRRANGLLCVTRDMDGREVGWREGEVEPGGTPDANGFRENQVDGRDLCVDPSRRRLLVEVRRR